MPYMRVGALKVSDHHVRSPLLNISRACQTCHRWPETELKARAAGTTDAQLASARDFQRQGQFLLDFIEAENSTGFHAPQEAARILAESINFFRQGQVALRDQKLSHP